MTVPDPTTDDVTALAAMCLDSLHCIGGRWKYRPDEAAVRILRSSWLAERDARVRAEALREAATPTGGEVSRRLLDIGHSPHIAGTAAALVQRALRTRADRVERGAS